VKGRRNTVEESAMVLESARRHLKDLSKLSDKLNKVSDAFTAELKAFETELNDLSLGVDVTVGTPIVHGHLEEVIDDADGSVKDQYTENLYLGYGRHGNGWCLLVRKFRDYQDSQGGPTRDVLVHEYSLLSAPRDIRVAAAEQIETLLERIKDQAKYKIESLSKVVDKK
jgi:hypothetical protein